MSKLAHSNQETMDEIERAADDLPEPPSWWCEPCKVEVYARACPHCGKTEVEVTHGADFARHLNERTSQSYASTSPCC